VHALVSMTQDVRVLTTSRAPLGLSSESVYRLPELSLPTTVELFEQRARAARPGVDLPADAGEEVCRHLDGLPLAVELAAARVRVMSVYEIARRLDRRADTGAQCGRAGRPPGQHPRPARVGGAIARISWTAGGGSRRRRPLDLGSLRTVEPMLVSGH
jgi:predicted ATPase